MRKFAQLLILMISVFSLSSCEKDDICIAGDTPKLRIGFYDTNNRSQAKEPQDLLIIGMDKSTILSTMVPADNEGFELLIPLNPSEEATSYYFVQNAELIDGTLSGAVELIEISYNIKAQYISKACGFIANYEQLSMQQQSVPSWIQEISVEQTSVINENEVHVKIYH